MFISQGLNWHSIDKCAHFHQKIQELLDTHFLTVYQKLIKHSKHEVDVAKEFSLWECSKVSLKPKPLTMFCREKSSTSNPNSKLTAIHVLALFEYKSSKEMPWSYAYKVTVEFESFLVENTNEIRCLTQSIRCYTRKELLKH